MSKKPLPGNVVPLKKPDAIRPLYVDYLEGRITGEDPSFRSRLDRIQSGFDRINLLLAELEKMEKR